MHVVKHNDAMGNFEPAYYTYGKFIKYFLPNGTSTKLLGVCENKRILYCNKYKYNGRS